MSGDSYWFDPAHGARVFGDGTGHVALRLQRVRHPSILWVNKQAAQIDPHFQRNGADMARYEQHLLEACAYAMPTSTVTAGETTAGYADRYGGSGIGSNGGSGRAAIVNGYHVKGIGRTPLVSALTDAAHASGGAYLEECVRETIFSEIVRHEFPASGVPVLAIIDLGIAQLWQSPAGVKSEWRTLLVRPSFLRPAHFVRAVGFVADDAREGARDTHRVERSFRTALNVFGSAPLKALYHDLWRDWARQLAYSFVHRLPFGSNTLSNITLHAQLLDFGAMSSVPTWADISTLRGREPFGSQIVLLRRAIDTTSYYFARYAGLLDDGANMATVLKDRAKVEYQRAVFVESLRVCGVARPAAVAAAVGPHRKAIWRAILDAIEYFQCECLDYVADAQPHARAWDIDLVWSEAPPDHLRALAQWVRHLVPADDWPAARARQRILSRSRPQLYREELRQRLFAALDQSIDGIRPDRDRIAHTIRHAVAAGRRDCRWDVPDAVPVGFAVGEHASYALFRRSAGQGLFAIAEPADGWQADLPPPLEITRMDDDAIVFAHADGARVVAAVSVHASVDERSACDDNATLDIA